MRLPRIGRRRKRAERAGGRRPEASPPASGDFADEHASPTLAGERRGGLEREPEPESPEGYAGLESRGLARRRRREQPDPAEERPGGDRPD